MPIPTSLPNLMQTRRYLFMFLTLLLLLTALPTSSFAGSDLRHATPSGISIQDLEAYIDEFVEPYIGKTTAAASIAVVQDGRTVFSKAYGYADIPNQIPATPDNIFEWGSISKLFVWTSVMQLVESNQLNLQTDIREYLPDHFLKRLRYDEPITLFHLMNHAAGFEEYMFDMAYTTPEQVSSLEEGLLKAEPAQIYPPGQTVAYSNYGNSLAAYIVERISGQSYADYVSEHILLPLKMNHTEIRSVLDDRPDLLRSKAKGYLSVEDGQLIEGPWNYMSMYPNGGANGTAEDLARFAMALMPASNEQSSLFRQSNTLSDMLSSSKSDDPYMPGIAHGFWEYPGASRTLGHGGNTMAFSSSLQFAPDEHFAVVVLTNQAGESHLVHGLSQALIGSPEIPASDQMLPESSLVTGSFVAARRPDQGFMSVYPYLSLMRVTSDKKNALTVKLAGYEGAYEQVRPYLYQRTGGDSELGAWPFIFFQTDQGSVTRVSLYTSDYLPLSTSHSLPLLTVQGIAAIAALLFFLTAPFVLLSVTWFKRKGQTGGRFTPLRIKTLIFIFSGTLLAANNLLLAYRMLSQNERPYSDVLPQVILNSVFAGSGLVALIVLLLEIKRRPLLGRRSKVGVGVSILLWVILIVLLIVWQFYR
ncbi:hypothetical protein GCM10007362_40210 [Saccharibacillus endophyticus]|uniref:Beta-lactamase-related domain-containing protein n=2 Tax=Saccharibacillus endophyticus TaxID=2060666 RepID=A0ABQ2A4A1_9BACL|nr:hypothetical protein GCM10007362_40210 [Saccharibacillus endophyticus]